MTQLAIERIVLVANDAQIPDHELAQILAEVAEEKQSIDEYVLGAQWPHDRPAIERDTQRPGLLRQPRFDIVPAQVSDRPIGPEGDRDVYQFRLAQGREDLRGLGILCPVEQAHTL